MFKQLTQYSAAAAGLGQTPAQLPEGAVRPYPHQLVMADAMHALEQRRSSEDMSYDCGVLASSAGSGKTLAAVMHATLHPILSASHETHKLLTCLEARVQKKMSVDHVYRVDATVVVVPSSLCEQWKTCVRRMARLPADVLVIYTRFGETEYTDLRARAGSNTTPRIILLTSNGYEQLIKFRCPETDRLVSRQFIFQRVVIDEADTLKVPGFEFLDAHFTWFVYSAH